MLWPSGSNKDPVIVGVVLGPQPRSAVVTSAGAQRRLVERVDLPTSIGTERNMDSRRVRFALGNPEVRLPRLSETGHRGVKLERQFVPEGSQGSSVESPTCLEAADDDSGVVDHSPTSRSRMHTPSCFTPAHSNTNGKNAKTPVAVLQSHHKRPLTNTASPPLFLSAGSRNA